MDFKKHLLAASLVLASATASATPTLGTVLLGDGSAVGGGGFATDYPFLGHCGADCTNATDTGFSAVRFTDIDGINDDATAYLLFEATSGLNSQGFGIYNYTTDISGNVTVGTTIDIFGGSAGQFSSKNVAYNILNGDVTVSGTTYANFGDVFGFYIDHGASTTKYYSHTSLNGGIDAALLFDTEGFEGLFGSDVVVAFEDNYGSNSDWDYNDLVVGISDVTPVAEPASLALLGLGLAGLGFARRKQKKA